jgi:hypothetical protein
MPSMMTTTPIRSLRRNGSPRIVAGNRHAEERVQKVERRGAGGADAFDQKEPDQRRNEAGNQRGIGKGGEKLPAPGDVEGFGRRRHDARDNPPRK